VVGDEEESKEPEKPLPGRVEQALSLARAAAKADRERKDGRWLVIVPVVIGVIFLGLLMPRATTPDAVPLPAVDRRVLGHVATEDDRAAAGAEATRLPTDVLAVGSAFRALKAAEAKDADPSTMSGLKAKLETSLAELKTRPNLEEDLFTLRALQTRHFLDALRTWEDRGETTNELVELGGSFVARLTEAGWATASPRRVILDDAQRRVAFKIVWNGILQFDKRPRFMLSLDEQRTMYTLYFEHPHPSESQRGGLVAQRKSALTPVACERANAEESRQTELWRADKIKRFGMIDADYPTSYALGVAYYRIGRFDLSADAFSGWLNEHPDGPYTLRARNHLKAAINAGGT